MCVPSYTLRVIKIKINVKSLVISSIVVFKRFDRPRMY